MKIILLKHGSLLLDDQDFTALAHLKWYSIVKGNSIYVRRNISRKEVAYKECKRTGLYIHQLILPSIDGLRVDHIDGNGLNNQRSNLRLVTHKQNMWNASIARSNNTSGIKGVYQPLRMKKYSKSWVARITVDYQDIHLGNFATKEEAARAYDKAAIHFYGEYARPNSPLESTII